LLALLVRLLRRIRPREGWLILLLCTTAVLCLPTSLLLAGWVQESGVLLGVTLLAMLVGFALARLPFPGWLSSLLAAIFGVEATVGLVGRALPPLRLVLDELAYALLWVWNPAQVVMNDRSPLPFQAMANDVERRLASFGSRLWWWAQGVASGGAQRDNLVFLFFVTLLVWAATSWAIWWLYRRQRVLVSLVPTGTLLAVNVFIAGEGESWLLIFLGCLTALLIAVYLTSAEQRWTAAGTDYSGEIRFDVFWVGMLITVAVVGVSVIVPSIASPRTVDWFWQRFSRPLEAVNETTQRMFPQLERAASSSEATAPGSGVLPRSHLLGGGPELSTQVVLRVWVNEPPPGQGGEQHYWRSRTYAVYNGRGWEQEELQSVERGAGEAWSEEPLVGRRELLQRVQVVGVPGRVLYAASKPLAPDRPYRALLRDAHDLVGMEATRRTGEYTILSAVPAVGEVALREAGEEYPDWVLERYLQLPPLPERVTELAAQLTAEAETPYERAQALESYLRTIPYTLDVEPPPEGRDVVDYFLFDLRKGYCDYYATAMVVLARSVGLPARLAVGYASGSYDEGFYVVTEKQAHSWVEVYFPRYGWIPFEPTAARGTFERRDAGGPSTEQATHLNEQLQELRELGKLTRLREAMRRWALWFGVGVAVLAVGGAVWIAWRRRSESELGAAQRFYLRLIRWGTRLGRGPAVHETPAEFARGLAERMAALAAAARWGRRRLLEQGQAAGQEAGELATIFVQARYGPHPLTETECHRAEALWQRLQRRLWALWVARWLRR
jgi:transglutaminase-like putative cysteine protease